MREFNNYEMSRSEFTVFCVCIAATGLLLSELFYRSILFSVVILPFAGRIKSYVCELILGKTRREYQIQFKDLLFMLSTSIGAGRSMKDAIAESVPSLVSIYGDEAVLVKELRKAYERMQAGGESDTDVLSDLAAASYMDDVVDFVTVYSICKSTGASLVTALNKAASVIIEKMTIEREIAELIRRKEGEGLLIFVMPVIVIVFLNMCAPDYIAPLYDTLAGRLIMTAVIACDIGIYGLITKIVNVDI